MDYRVHITRKKHWDDIAGERGPDISLEEWLAVVTADRELRLRGLREVPDGSLLHHADASIAIWRQRPRRGRAANAAWLRLAGGNVVATKPDRHMRRKMWRIAQVLRAKVQGNGGEFYDRFGSPVADAADMQGYWRALRRYFVFRFIWGPSRRANPLEAHTRFPVVESIYKTSPSGMPQVSGRRMLNIIMRKGSITPDQRAAIAAARERAKALGIDLILTEEEPH